MPSSSYDPSKRRDRVDGEKYPGLWWRRRKNDIVWELKLSQANVDISGTIYYEGTRIPVKKESEAINAWKTATAARDKGEQVLAVGNATLDQIANLFFEGLESKVETEARAWNTLRTYRSNYKSRIEPFFSGHRKINQITDRDIARYISTTLKTNTQHGGKMKPNSVMSSLTVLGKIMKLALKNGAILSNPFDGVDEDDRVSREVAEEDEPRVLRPDELRQLIAACPPLYLLPLIVLCYSGCRISELCGLVWGDVDLGKRTIRIARQRGPTGRSRAKVKSKASKRTMGMFAQAYAALEEQRRRCVEAHGREPFDDEFVFATSTGLPIHPQNFRPRGVQKAGVDAGLGHIKPHDLRHTFASLMAQAPWRGTTGIPVTIAARWMGHTVATFVKEYAHSWGDALEREETVAAMELTFAEEVSLP